MKNKLYVPISIVAFAILFTVFSETASLKTLSSLENCINNIIPALFPFMVISSMIVYSGASDILGRIFPISKIYSLPVCASAPIIIGAICGFPLGAKSAAELFERGYLNKTEAEILISAANNTGPSFIIFIIGARYWNDINFGIFLYISQLLCSVISSIIVNRFLFPTTHKKLIKNSPIKINSFTESLSKAIISASVSSLNICGFITFFSVLSSVSQNLLSFLPVNINIFLLGLLEFSDASLMTSYHKSLFSIFICGFSIGWSGLSVFCQTASFTVPLKLSLKRCLLTKLIQGILLGSFTVIYSSNIDIITTIYPSYKVIKILPLLILTLLIIVCCIYIIKKRKGA